MPASRLFLVFALLGCSVGLLGCGSDDADDGPPAVTYDVRGRFLGTATDGRDVVVRHEAIPDVMPSMTMTVQKGDAVSLQSIDKGDPVQFTLSIRGSRLRVESMEALPDTTTLAFEEAETDR